MPVGAGMNLQVDKIPLPAAAKDHSLDREAAGKENATAAPVPTSSHSLFKKKSSQPKKSKPKKLVTFEECLPEVGISGNSSWTFSDQKWQNDRTRCLDLLSILSYQIVLC
jgi:hypothetical protein